MDKLSAKVIVFTMNAINVNHLREPLCSRRSQSAQHVFAPGSQAMDDARADWPLESTPPVWRKGRVMHRANRLESLSYSRRTAKNTVALGRAIVNAHESLEYRRCYYVTGHRAGSALLT